MHPMQLEPCTHPLCVMARTDGTIRSLYHSFFCVVASAHDVRVCRRIPAHREDLEDIESGLKLFLISQPPKTQNGNLARDGLSLQIDEDQRGTFVVTTSNSRRYFCFWRGFQHRYFVCVSTLPLTSYSREILGLLGDEPAENILSTLLGLCEVPIFPACGLRYDLHFSRGTASLSFSAIEQVDDAEVLAVALQLLNARMLVSAWESIILERKVLVVSSVAAVIAPCCEFLRRLALPLVIVHTYVPFLPEILINTVEAPFPYLVGADLETLRQNPVDLSETVVIDLDARSVILPRKTNGISENGGRAPPMMMRQLHHEVSNILLNHISSSFSRACSNSSMDHGSSVRHVPRSSEGAAGTEASICRAATLILQVFVRQNLALIGARNCSIRAFLRRPKAPMFQIERNKRLSQVDRPSQDIMGSLGFELVRGVAYGFMQMLRSSGISDRMQHFMPCWVEMDDTVLAVYEYADDLPILYIRCKDIQSVSPSPLEPEGYIFELITKQGSVSTYRFQTMGPDARGEWLRLVDVKIKSKDLVADDGQDSSSGGTSLSLGHFDDQRKAVLNSGGNGDGQGMGGDVVSNPLAGEDAEVVGFSRSAGNWDDQLVNSRGGGMSLGFYSATDAVVTDGDEEALSKFRSHFFATQMVSFLESSLDAGEEYYDVLMNVGQERGLTVKDILQDIADESVEEMFSAGISTEGMAISTVLKQIEERVASKCAAARKGSEDDAAVLTPVPSRSELQTPGAAEKSTEPSRETFSDASALSPKIATDGDLDEIPKLELPESPTRTLSAERSANDAAPSSTNGTGSIMVIKPKKKNSIFGSLFSQRWGRDEKDDAAVTAAMLKAAEATQQTEHMEQSMRVEEEKKRKWLLSRIQQVAMAHRQCEDELQKSLVTDRLEIMASLAMVHRDALSGRAPTEPLEIWLTLLGRNAHDAALGTTRQSSGSTVLSPPPSPEPGPTRSSTHALSTPSMQTEASTADTFHALWYDHIFGALHVLSPPAAVSTPTATLPGTDEFEVDIDGGGGTHEVDEDILHKFRESLLVVLLQSIDVAKCQSSRKHLVPLLQTMAGYTHEGLRHAEQAVSAYAAGALTDQNRLVRCVANYLLTFAQSGGSFDVLSFLNSCNQLSPLVGLQAYRMVTELIYKALISKMSLMSASSVDSGSTVLVQDIAILGSYRRALSGFRNGKQTPGEVHGDVAQFSWEPNAESDRAETLNETVTCLSSPSAAHPCDLSVQLLTRLRELLIAYAQSPNGSKHAKRNYSGYIRLDINASTLADLAESSAFHAFELQVCQLQKVIPESGLKSTNQRVLFFCNVYNTLVVHAIIKKGSPGGNFVERLPFMRSAKYRIGDLVFSLLDIEHGILRAKSNRAMVFGPFPIDMAFQDRDPRKNLCLTEPVPYITFALFFACPSSPSLRVLRDTGSINAQLQEFAAAFVQQHVRVDKKESTFYLPDCFRIYWGDFGKSRAGVLRKIMLLSTPEVARELRPFVSKSRSHGTSAGSTAGGGTDKAKVKFDGIDWSPRFIL